ncbi:hypothetical protein GIB67_035021 [Kingdonia uniflora]|uniref:RNA helicase n=1 Tax=Kingdonia uniflora TaxID=39325 RepID=A0A7J7L1L8_9MAGN|nr:hypothetical protein GIB67_035021 [Kingdonia uniflora]
MKERKHTPKNQGTAIRKPCLNNSDEKKFLKSKEVKAKKAQLFESIRTLEYASNFLHLLLLVEVQISSMKYKIQESSYSLFSSSGSIGQRETWREKRRRAMQFSEKGLKMPQDGHPSKKKRDTSFCQNEPNPRENQANQDFSVDNLLQQIILEREDINNSCGPSDTCPKPTCSTILDTANGVSGTDLPALEFANKNSFTYMQDNNNIPSLIPCSFERSKSTRAQEVVGPNVHCCTSWAFADNAAQRPNPVPIVIHVSRPVEVESKRNDLPIVMMEQEVMEAINESSAVIISGETGCGKTTQVPQFLYEAGYGSSKSGTKSGIIGVTQPRRIAVLATARRVAFELGLHLGKEVGYQIRHDKMIGDNCSIKFMTDGILLREMQNDFILKRYSVIVLDEVHERSLNTDILIGMLSTVIKLRQELYQEQQERILLGKQIVPEHLVYPLKLVLMSATLQVKEFTSAPKLFCVPPPVIEVSAREYPVTICFSKRTETVEYIKQAYKTVMKIHKKLPPGGILVFVTGRREVEGLCRNLREASRNIIKSQKLIDNVVTVSPEANIIDEGIGIKEISEALEVDGDSMKHQNRSFSSNAMDSDFFVEDESYLSSSSGTESEVSYDDKEDDETQEDATNLAAVFGEAGSFDLIIASFDALTKKTVQSNHYEKNSDSVNFSAPVNVKKPERNRPSVGALSVLPLYSMLPETAQFRVFEKVNEGERLVVVATNIAETSVTIPGIKYVVDTGREKVKHYDPSNGTETYGVQWISKASAEQRAGRAGRIGPGHCFRLYTPAVFSEILPDYSVPEISKIPLDGILLLIKSLGIKVVDFSFITPPEITALAEAERCLKFVDALDSCGKITPLGTAMAHYPTSPRHSRMLLSIIQNMKNIYNYTRANLVLGYAIAVAAALITSNSFVMQLEPNYPEKDNSSRNEKSDKFKAHKFCVQQENLSQKDVSRMARLAKEKFNNPRSDALTMAYALQMFERAQNPVKFCQEHTLHFKTMDEMSKLRKQLLKIVFNQSCTLDSKKDFIWSHGNLEDVKQAWSVSADENFLKASLPNKKMHPLNLYEENHLRQAICAGWADRVAKRVRVVSKLSDGDRNVVAVRYQACRVSETVFLSHCSSVSLAPPEFLVYNELLHTKRLYMNGVTSVEPDWLVKYAGSLCTLSAPLTDPKPWYESSSDQVLCKVRPTFGPHLWQLPLHTMLIKDDILRASTFACALLEGHVLPCLKPFQEFMAAHSSSVLRPEAFCQGRVWNLLSKLRMKNIYSRGTLKKAWKANPKELYSEIWDWFRGSFHSLERSRSPFETLWAQMHREVLLKHNELFSNSGKKEKRKR